MLKCSHYNSIFLQVKMLLKAGANVLATNRWGNMAIDDAIRVQATPVVELLKPLVEQVSVNSKQIFSVVLCTHRSITYFHVDVNAFNFYPIKNLNYP